MNKIQFLGIYAGNLEIPVKKKNFAKKQYWFVWFLASENKYIVVNIDEQQAIPSFFLTNYQFSENFIEEKGIQLPEPPCPPLQDIQFYDVATKETAFNSTREAPQSVSLQNRKQIQERRNERNTKNLAYITPAKQEVRSNTIAYDTAKHKINASTHNPELARQNKLARMLNDEILQTLADIIQLWKNNEKDSAVKKVKLLLERNDTYVTAHKHTFTKCAIQLRKLQKWDLALQFALRCVEISPDDSHAYFNVARIYFEEKAYEYALDYIKKALELEVDMEAAHRLHKAITSKL